MSLKKILSIDGGGIRGAFAASFLATVEASATVEQGREVKIGEYFDLITGTSTGGIIAIALGIGYSASEIVDLFGRLGPEVFEGSSLRRWWRSLVASRHSDEPLRRVLTDAFGTQLLSDSRVRLVIPALSTQTLRPRMFKTAHHPRFKVGVRTSLVDVAMSTAAAPTYFPSHRLVSGVPLLDGGLVAHNPMAIGAVEAIAVLGWKPGEFEILSIGCTSPPPPKLDASRTGRGLPYWGWGARIVDVMMRAQSETSHGIAGLLAGREHVVRVNPWVEPGRFSLDGVEGIDDLCALGVDVADYRYEQVRRFFAAPAVPFSACQ